jgi:hypothetical protein
MRMRVYESWRAGTASATGQLWRSRFPFLQELQFECRALLTFRSNLNPKFLSGKKAFLNNWQAVMLFYIQFSIQRYATNKIVPINAEIWSTIQELSKLTRVATLASASLPTRGNPPPPEMICTPQRHWLIVSYLIIRTTKFVKLPILWSQISPCRPRKQILLNFFLGLSGRCHQTPAKAKQKHENPFLTRSVKEGS